MRKHILSISDLASIQKRQIAILANQDIQDSKIVNQRIGIFGFHDNIFFGEFQPCDMYFPSWFLLPSQSLRFDPNLVQFDNFNSMRHL